MLIQTRMFKILKKVYLLIAYLMLILFVPLLLIENYFSKGWVYFFMLFFLPVAIVFNNTKKGLSYYSSFESLYLFLIFLFLVYGYVFGYFGQLEFGIENSRFYVASEVLSKFSLPFILFPVFFILKPKFNWIKVSLLLAGVVVTATLFYDLGTGHGRYARLFGAPIIYGDMAMLVGVLLLLLALFETFPISVLYLVLGFLGIAASIYSGSRGGWIALFSLPVLYVIYNKYFLKKHVGWKKTASVFLVLGLSFVVMYKTVPVVEKRVNQAFYDISNALKGKTASSLGMRFEMWKVSIQAFKEYPLTGVGFGNFYSYKKQKIENNEAPKFVERFKHEHSTFFTLISSFGIIGTAIFTLLYVYLYKIYYAALKNERFKNKILGLMGITILIFYIDFGLSESFNFTHIGAAAFFYLNTFLIYLHFHDK